MDSVLLDHKHHKKLRIRRRQSITLHDSHNLQSQVEDQPPHDSVANRAAIGVGVHHSSHGY